jgi:Fe-S cluster biogenesis protein NfuA
MIQNFVTIYTEATPNPETMKFVLNRYLSPDQTFEYKNVEEASLNPFASKLFDFPFVDNVFISSHYVTITRKQGEDWDEIIPLLKDFIKNYVEAGLAVLPESPSSHAEDDGNQSEQAVRIRQILKDYVQPAVEQDGGAIQYKSFDNEKGIVTVTLKGSCSGCPSSMITLKSGIEGLLKRMVPEVSEVVAENM